MSLELDLLIQKIKEISIDNKLCIAFSGGVDSTVLLAASKMAGVSVLAVTFDISLSKDKTSIYEAQDIAKDLSIEHKIISIDILSNEKVRHNDKQRCYYCKKMLFQKLIEIACENGYNAVADGSNADDLKEYRPGLLALKELNILSPIALCGLAKSDVRMIAKEMNLSVAKKPSSPCLMTRFPYDTFVTTENLEKVAQAERILKSNGFLACRFRMYPDCSKIEIPLSDFGRFSMKKDLIFSQMRPLHLYNIILDEKGLRSGAMDGK